MLAYLVVRALRQAWAAYELTMEEGLQQLATLNTKEIHRPGRLPEDPYAAGGIAALAPGAGYPPAGGPAVEKRPVTHEEKTVQTAQN